MQTHEKQLSNIDTSLKNEMSAKVRGTTYPYICTYMYAYIHVRYEYIIYIYIDIVRHKKYSMQSTLYMKYTM